MITSLGLKEAKELVEGAPVSFFRRLFSSWAVEQTSVIQQTFVFSFPAFSGMFARGLCVVFAAFRICAFV